MTPLVKMAHDLPDDYERRAICNYTISLISNSGIADEYLNEIVESFAKVKEDLDDILNREYASSYTGDIKKSHANRLKYIKDIDRGLSFFNNHFDSGKVKSAETISEIYNRCFNDLPDRKYATYTQVIDTFLSQVKTTTVIPAFEDLEMMELVDLLANSQTSFLSFKTKRAHEEAEETHPYTADVRTEMHDIYETLDRHLFFKQHRGSAEYEELTQKLNRSITEILAVAKSRKTLENNNEAKKDIPAEETLTSDLHEELEEIHDEMHAEDSEEI